jgi:hypothetical protein
MNGAIARQPTETELKAHQRRMIFREKIAERAAALELQNQTPQVVPAESDPPAAEVVTVEFPPLPFSPMKRPWFSIVGVRAPAPLRVSEIQIVICEAFGCDLVELNATRRTARIVRARQVGMYLAKVLTGRSLPEIGRRFGGRDHTTVLHAVRKIAAKVEFAPETPELFDPELSDFVNALRSDIEARRGE